MLYICSKELTQQTEKAIDIESYSVLRITPVEWHRIVLMMIRCCLGKPVGRSS